MQKPLMKKNKNNTKMFWNCEQSNNNVVGSAVISRNRAITRRHLFIASMCCLLLLVGLEMQCNFQTTGHSVTFQWPSTTKFKNLISTKKKKFQFFLFFLENFWIFFCLKLFLVFFWEIFSNFILFWNFLNFPTKKI